MGLLDEIKKKTKPKHELNHLNLELRINYIQAIAFFIAIDDVIEEDEKNKFQELINNLECQDMLDDLIEFLDNPLVDDFEDIFDLLNNNGNLKIFMSEIKNFKKSFNKDEKEFIEIISNRYNFKIKKKCLKKTNEDVHIIDSMGRDENLIKLLGLWHGRI